MQKQKKTAEFFVGQEIHIKLANGDVMKGQVVKVRRRPNATKYRYELSLEGSPYLYFEDEE
jgi:ribosomal protein L35AE/L33A